MIGAAALLAPLLGSGATPVAVTGMLVATLTLGLTKVVPPVGAAIDRSPGCSRVRIRAAMGAVVGAGRGRRRGRSPGSRRGGRGPVGAAVVGGGPATSVAGTAVPG